MKLRNKKVIPHRPSRGLPRGAVMSGEDSKCRFRLFIPQALTDISDTVHQDLPVFCEDTKSSSRLVRLRAGTALTVTVNKGRGHLSNSSTNSSTNSSSNFSNSSPYNSKCDLKYNSSPSSYSNDLKCNSPGPHINNMIGPCNLTLNRSTRCKMCIQMDFSKEVFYSSVTNRKYSVIFRDSKTLDCTSDNVVYLVTCTRCKIQYVGETQQTVAKRMSGHRNTITNTNILIANHFNGPCKLEL
jgi:hypothetical protein